MVFFRYYSFNIKKRVPLVSLKPFLSPAIENGWQGNPAVNTSKSGISPASVVVMSFSGFSLKFSSYVSAVFYLYLN
ncbi:MAG: hypothetical protein CM15mP96_1170 [Gammaproteobacteria bacterium]|nr:MAG: hypothetical protein CM15mP96_1170 [Gammaproteobacteria bacterium]